MNKSKKQDFLKELSYLGEFKMQQLFLKTGQESVRIYSGHLLSDEILKIWRHFPVEGLGLYFGKQIIDRHGVKEARLSLDALHTIRKDITDSIVEINHEQVEKWFRGNNVELTPEQKNNYSRFVGKFVAVKFGEDFVGTARLSADGILISFLPKERRIRN